MYANGLCAYSTYANDVHANGIYPDVIHAVSMRANGITLTSYVRAMGMCALRAFALTLYALWLCVLTAFSLTSYAHGYVHELHLP